MKRKIRIPIVHGRTKYADTSTTSTAAVSAADVESTILAQTICARVFFDKSSSEVDELCCRLSGSLSKVVTSSSSSRFLLHHLLFIASPALSLCTRQNCSSYRRFCWWLSTTIYLQLRFCVMRTQQHTHTHTHEKHSSTFWWWRWRGFIHFAYIFVSINPNLISVPVDWNRMKDWIIRYCIVIP